MFRIATPIISIVLVWFLVLNPARASYLTRLALRLNIPPMSKAMILSEAVSIEPCNEVALNNFAVAAVQAGNFDLAVKVLARSVECSPNDAIHWVNLGEALFGMHKNGTEYIRHGVKMEPHNPLFHASLDRAEASVKASIQQTARSK